MNQDQDIKVKRIMYLRDRIPKVTKNHEQKEALIEEFVFLRYDIIDEKLAQKFKRKFLSEGIIDEIKRRQNKL